MNLEFVITLCTVKSPLFVSEQVCTWLLALAVELFTYWIQQLYRVIQKNVSITLKTPSNTSLSPQTQTISLLR